MTVLEAMEFLFDQLSPWSWIAAGWCGGIIHYWVWLWLKKYERELDA